MAEQLEVSDRIVELTSEDGSTVLLRLSTNKPAKISYDGVIWHQVNTDAAEDYWEDYR